VPHKVKQANELIAHIRAEFIPFSESVECLILNRVMSIKQLCLYYNNLKAQFFHGISQRSQPVNAFFTFKLSHSSMHRRYSGPEPNYLRGEASPSAAPFNMKLQFSRPDQQAEICAEVVE
jgi:hypothetical protein